MQIILDANIYISFAIRSTALKPLRDAYSAEKFTPLVSTYLLAEVENVLNRPKFDKYIKQDEKELALKRIITLAKIIQIKQPFPEFSDHKDRYLLAMLRDSEAEILVTGDKKLLAVETYNDKTIISPQNFMNKYI